MNWDQAVDFIKRHFSVAIVFAILFALGMAFMWSENRNLQADYRTLYAGFLNERKEIHKKELQFKDMQIQYEKEKAEIEVQLTKMNTSAERSLENANARMKDLKRMLELAENEPSIQEKKKELNSLIEQYRNAIFHLNETTSIEKKRNNAQEWIVKAMNDFSKLGVDMQSPDSCDKEYMRRYNEGAALINQIRALNDDYLDSDEIALFVRQNEQSLVVMSDDCETFSAM
jgi:hypothetical protein